MQDPKANNVLVETLSSALRYGGHALVDVPTFLKDLLLEDAWRDFVTRRGEPVHHDSWSSFVTTPPLKGLGGEVALVDRLAGTNDPDLLRMLREAKKVGQGTRTELHGDSPSSVGDDTTSLAASRLARDHPEEYQAVQRGEKSINAAAIDAGIRKRRTLVRLDNWQSAARTLRRHMDPDVLAELIDELTRDRT